MTTGWKVTLLTLVMAAITFPMSAGAPLGKYLWPPDPMGPSPTGGQLPLFLLLNAFETVSFGKAISFLVFVEYGFHVTLMAAGVILDTCFLATLRDGCLGKAKQAA